MRKIFVTGSNGLLGTNLIELLINQGFYVKALVRNLKRYHGPQHNNLELIVGALYSDLSNHLKEVDCVIHVAAMTDQSETNYARYYDVNCASTLHLATKANKHNVKKFIFVSTANSIGYGSFQFPGVESNIIRAPFDASYYAESKRIAEISLLRQSYKMNVVIVNPTFMLGAYDSKPSSGKMVLMALNKKIIFYPPGGKNIVHVNDVAQGIINCIQKGENGEKYLLANVNIPYKVFFKQVVKFNKQKSLLIPVPKFLLLLVGYIGDLIRLTGINTNISSVNMKILCVNNYYSNKKSKQKLNLKYQPLDIILKDTIDYFKSKT